MIRKFAVEFLGTAILVFFAVGVARSLGPALVVGGAALSQVWLFIVAPLIGGVLAAGLHQLLYRGEEESLAAEAQQARTAAV